MEQKAGEVGGHGLAEGAEEGDEEDHPQHLPAIEERAYIDEHAHTDKEIGDEEGIADKLYAIHQG